MYVLFKIFYQSSDIASAAYESLWYNVDLTMQKILIHVILRSQHPVTVSVPCALPNLSMNYYASVRNCIVLYIPIHISQILRFSFFRTLFDYFFAFNNLLFFQYISTVFSYMAFVRIKMGQEQKKRYGVKIHKLYFFVMFAMQNCNTSFNKNLYLLVRISRRYSYRKILLYIYV